MSAAGAGAGPDPGASKPDGWIERIIELSIRNRLLVLLLVAAVALWGVYALTHTPVDAIPDLSENQVIVFADWPGRSPKEVEDQITYPLSVNLQGLAGVKAVRSTSEFNFSMVNIIFEEDVDFYFARQRVLERLSIASTFLPEGVVPYLAPDATALGQVFWYTVEGGGKDLGELRAIQDWYVRYQLNSVPGVAQVASAGGFVREYQVDIDPGRLRAYGVTLGEVFEAVARSNSSVGGNVVEKNRAEYLVRGFGWIREPKDIESVVVAERKGVPIYVRNVATVQVGPAPRRSALEKEGREAVGGVVLMRYGENPLEVIERVKAKIRALEPGLPAGVRIVPFYDRTRLIREAIDTLSRTLIEEIILASLVVFLVLYHFRSAFVICVTLPLAVLISFIFMYHAGVTSNILSLAGIAISIGVLVDAGIVMTENAYARLHDRFGKEKVTGDTRELVLRACKIVGRPLFFSVLIMVISFLPVFALTGIEGKMFRPFAFTKTFALIGVSVLAITLVPALIPTFVRGRLRGEDENWLVRSVAAVYRPVLLFLLDRPKWVAVNLALLFGMGLYIYPKLGREFMPPLDEGALMDMPTTSPSVSMSQAVGDLVVRDELLRSLPEVEMVVGKVGRADTATDPAPPDMIETVITLRPKDQWPRRALDFDVFEREARRAVRSEGDAAAVAMDAAARFDETMRELARRRIREFQPELERAGPGEEGRARLLRERVRRLDWELEDRAGGVLAAALAEAARAHGIEGAHFVPPADKPFLRRKKQNEVHDGKVVKEIRDELDTILQVPGWGNSWTRPIQNRVDMLATGVRSQVGVKVFGSDRLPLEQALEEVQRVSNEVAAALREVPGAVDVFPDQATGERYLEIVVDRERAARYGVRVGDIQDTIEVALGGKQITTTVEGRRRFPVRVRYARDFREDEETVKRLLVSGPSNLQVPLSEVADVSIVEGPSMIRSENGLLRSYVQLNVKDRDLLGFIEEARRVVSDKVKLPPGMYIEWSGEFEHQVRARRTLSLVLPAVVFLIFLILYLTYRDLADAALMMLAVPGALAGGLLFQWIFGHDFTVAVWVGYIVAFGLATETGIVMLVYLREAIDRRGGLEGIGSLEELKAAITEGAVHRLRPKLLTESTTILGLVPMLWATGAGAEIMRPMAAPVIGGILFADEVIDVFIPVIFYRERRRRWLKAHPEAAEASSAAASPVPVPVAVATFLALAVGLTGCLGAERAGQRAEADRALAALAPEPAGGADAADRSRDVEDFLTRAPTLDAVRGAVVHRNPDLRAALERWVEYLERVPQRTAPPFPSLTYRYSSFDRIHMVEAMQEVPFPTKLAAEGRAALAEARAVRAEARERENALRERASVAYAELYFARRQVDLVSESLRHVERILELVRTKVGAGTAPQSDLLRIEVERDTLLASHAGQKADAEVAAGALNVLLDRRPEAPIGKLAPPPAPAPAGAGPAGALPPLETLYAAALEARPELQAARERTAAADEMLSRARQEWVPDLALGAAYVRDFDEDENEVELIGGITVPLYAGRADGAAAEAEAGARRARAEQRSALNRVLEEIRAAWLGARAAAERHRLLAGAALPRARETVATSETAYMAEKIDFLALVDAQRMRLATELEAERALADYARRSAELERAVGRPREQGR